MQGRSFYIKQFSNGALAAAAAGSVTTRTWRARTRPSTEIREIDAAAESIIHSFDNGGRTRSGGTLFIFPELEPPSCLPWDGYRPSRAPSKYASFRRRRRRVVDAANAAVADAAGRSARRHLYVISFVAG